MRDQKAAGKKAKAQGKIFEDIFERACLALAEGGLVCTRVPDGCRQVGRDHRGMPRLVRMKSPWDWVVTWNGTTALFDTKSKGSKAFGFSDVDGDQARELWKHEDAGGVAGYVVWLRESGNVIFIPAHMLVANLGARGSFTPATPGVLHLGVLTDQFGRVAGHFEVCRIFKGATE